jgi:hypothetical protein
MVKAITFSLVENSGFYYGWFGDSPEVGILVPLCSDVIGQLVVGALPHRFKMVIDREPFTTRFGTDAFKMTFNREENKFFIGNVSFRGKPAMRRVFQDNFNGEMYFSIDLAC